MILMMRRCKILTTEPDSNTTKTFQTIRSLNIQPTRRKRKNGGMVKNGYKSLVNEPKLDIYINSSIIGV